MMDLSGISTYTEIADLLADPELDMIDVCLPPALHAQVTLAALKAGKHVFCEKPIALEVADARQMVRTASQTGRQLLIGVRQGQSHAEGAAACVPHPVDQGYLRAPRAGLGELGIDVRRHAGFDFPEQLHGYDSLDKQGVHLGDPQDWLILHVFP